MPVRTTYQEKMLYQGPSIKDRISNKGSMFSSVEFGPKESKMECNTENRIQFVRPSNASTSLSRGKVVQPSLRLGKLKTEREGDLQTCYRNDFAAGRQVPTKIELSSIKNDQTSHHFKMGHMPNYDEWKRMKPNYGAIASNHKQDVQNLVNKNRSSNITLSIPNEQPKEKPGKQTIHQSTFKWIQPVKEVIIF